MLVASVVPAVIRVQVIIIIVVSGVVAWFTDCMDVGVVALLFTVGGKRGVSVQRGGRWHWLSGWVQGGVGGASVPRFLWLQQCGHFQMWVGNASIPVVGLPWQCG